jgi:UDP-3-O-[3-hydroxymyristoyl] glucosamine N-acyltransferase
LTNVLTLASIVERLNAQGLSARLDGNGDCEIRHVASLADAGADDITFLVNSRLKKDLQTTAAAAVIVSADDADAVPGRAVIVENPHVAYAHVTAWLYAEDDFLPGIHASAVVDPCSQVHETALVGAHCTIEAGAVIAAECQIGPGCVVGKNVVLGEGSQLVANVTLCHGTQIGRRAILHPGAVIGADGFGLANDRGEWVKVPQVGNVVLGDDVEVGANTTIDRGAIGDTVLEDGVKLDNQIQIAHNVHIGAHTAMAACSAVAGSTRIGKHCAIGGHVGIVGHLEIADNVTVTAMSFVSQAITRPGVYSSGTPLEENAKWHRNFVRIKQLDDMARRLKKLENQLAAPEHLDETKNND